LLVGVHIQIGRLGRWLLYHWRWYVRVLEGWCWRRA